MAAQYTELLRATGVDYLGTDAEEEDQTHLETMQAFDTIELDEEELVLAREAAKQRVNRTQVRPNLYSYDWSDAHGAFWDRVKKRLTTRLDAWGASLDKVQTKAVSPGTAIGTRKEEIYLLLAHFQLDDK
ncbi:phosphotransferase enzyme family protein, partial [Metarhizium majus ARSEF 297]